jgi:hypothetical protein
MPTNNTHQRGRAKILRELQGPQSGDSPCSGIGSRGTSGLTMCFSQFPPYLLIWCMVIADAYTQHMPKGDGKEAILRELQGVPLLDCVWKGRR